MSGYEKSNTSKLGGGAPGGIPSAGFANTNTSSEMALKRKILRKAFKTNKVTVQNNKKISATCGPFRAANNLGDVLGRVNQSCGGCNQVNDTNSNVLNSRMADGVGSSNCSTTVHGVTPSEVPLASGNAKFVANSSEFTRFKTLSSINLNYNDKSFGGDEHNGSYSFIRNLRG